MDITIRDDFVRKNVCDKKHYYIRVLLLIVSVFLTEVIASSYIHIYELL